MTQLPIPRQTAPFWDSSRFLFLLPPFLGQAQGSLQECGLCLGLGAAASPLGQISHGLERRTWENLGIGTSG